LAAYLKLEINQVCTGVPNNGDGENKRRDAPRGSYSAVLFVDETRRKRFSKKVPFPLEDVSGFDVSSSR
jgi:hypothetical protein